MAQWLACWAHNPKVRGSKPRSATITRGPRRGERGTTRLRPRLRAERATTRPRALWHFAYSLAIRNNMRQRCFSSRSQCFSGNECNRTRLVVVSHALTRDQMTTLRLLAPRAPSCRSTYAFEDAGINEGKRLPRAFLVILLFCSSC